MLHYTKTGYLLSTLVGKGMYMAENSRVQSAVTYKMIAEALFENYESIYDINLETQHYKTYFQSGFYEDLKLAKEGMDFFDELGSGIRRIIAPEDQNYVCQMLQRETLIEGIRKHRHYRLVYQIQTDSKKIYHQLSATSQQAEDGMHILMGIKNIDESIRQRIEQEKKIEAMQQKEFNHLEAILSTAAVCIEGNLSANLITETTINRKEDVFRKIINVQHVSAPISYDTFQEQLINCIDEPNKECYRRISSREYLIDCFRRGEKRASVSFSIHTRENKQLPCRALFYLYLESSSRHLHVFCVIYDLTEQQRKEKELKEMHRELMMSRIRNSTSQMQPHFLYNALCSIQELILIDPNYASDLLGDFMIHLRSCIRAMTSDEPVMFEEELQNIKAYVNIEKMRLGDKLKIKYDIKEKDFLILPLCIQPIVENAIRHGIHKRGQKGGEVTIRTGKEQGMWVIQVEDTGIGFDVNRIRSEVIQGKRDSTGLNNLFFRLEKVMGASMDIYSVEGKGTTVTIHLPMGE